MTSDQVITYCKQCGARTEEAYLVFFRTPDHKPISLVEIDECEYCKEMESD
jgi:hypothetical protein